MNLLMIGFDDRRAAQEALDELEIASEERDVQLRELALVYRSRLGRSKVRQTSDAGSSPSLVQGGLLGLLVAVAPPFGSDAVAEASGALAGVIAGVGSNGVDNQMMRSLAASVHDHDGVVLALGDEAQFCRLHDIVEAEGARAQWLTLPEATVNLVRGLSKLSMDDLAYR
ncbi:MAG: hypothetical protein ACR2QO_04510 [Acidimicrobiales bacterium]